MATDERISNVELNRKSVDELREILQFSGLSHDGGKYALVQRLNLFWDNGDTLAAAKYVLAARRSGRGHPTLLHDTAPQTLPATLFLGPLVGRRLGRPASLPHKAKLPVGRGLRSPRSMRSAMALPQAQTGGFWW